MGFLRRKENRPKAIKIQLKRDSLARSAARAEIRCCSLTLASMNSSANQGCDPGAVVATVALGDFFFVAFFVALGDFSFAGSSGTATGAGQGFALRGVLRNVVICLEIPLFSSTSL
jgi:hypothetical protein